MFLKVLFREIVKKMKFKEEWATLPNFLELIKELTGLPVGSFNVRFEDAEGDMIPIADCHDLEYFVTSFTDQKFATIYVTEKDEADRSAGFMDISQNEKLQQAEQQAAFEERIEQESQTEAVNNDDKATDAPQMKIETEEMPHPSQSFWAELQNSINNSQTNTQNANAQVPSFEVLLQSVTSALGPLFQTRAAANNNTYLETRLAELESKLNTMSQNMSQNTSQQHNISATSQNIAPEPKPTPKEPEVVHFGVSCDECGVTPIKGRRYKCLVCHNFDLCTECEQRTQHEHPMVRCNAQGNHYALNKIQRKFTKLTSARRGFGSRTAGHGGLHRFGCPFRGRPRNPEPIPTVVEERIQPNQPEETIQPQNNEQDDVEKRNILKFMFNSEDNVVMDELIRRFKSLSLAEFCEAISLEYAKAQ